MKINYIKLLKYSILLLLTNKNNFYVNASEVEIKCANTAMAQQFLASNEFKNRSNENGMCRGKSFVDERDIEYEIKYNLTSESSCSLHIAYQDHPTGRIYLGFARVSSAGTKEPILDGLCAQRTTEESGIGKQLVNSVIRREKVTAGVLSIEVLSDPKDLSYQENLAQYYRGLGPVFSSSPDGKSQINLQMRTNVTFAIARHITREIFTMAQFKYQALTEKPTDVTTAMISFSEAIPEHRNNIESKNLSNENAAKESVKIIRDYWHKNPAMLKLLGQTELETEITSALTSYQAVNMDPSKEKNPPSILEFVSRALERLRALPTLSTQKRPCEN